MATFKVFKKMGGRFEIQRADAGRSEMVGVGIYESDVILTLTNEGASEQQVKDALAKLDRGEDAIVEI